MPRSRVSSAKNLVTGNLRMIKDITMADLKDIGRILGLKQSAHKGPFKRRINGAMDLILNNTKGAKDITRDSLLDVAGIIGIKNRHRMRKSELARHIQKHEKLH